MMNKDKIYKLDDLNQHSNAEDMVAWIQGLNKSGYAGMNKQGQICDRREFPDAIPVQRNSLFGVVEPKPLPNEEH